MQQQLQQQQMHQQQFQQQLPQQPHNNLISTEGPSSLIQEHTATTQQFFRSNGQQEMVLRQQQVKFFTIMNEDYLKENLMLCFSHSL